MPTKRTQQLAFQGAHGNALKADLHRSAIGQGPLALFAHGGGQTRHSWRGAAQALAAKGWNAVTLDQRGHGDSAWVADAAYGLPDYAADLKEVTKSLEEQGLGRAVVIGASLGGMAGLVAAGELQAPIRALVLVDITPSVRPEGLDRIFGFMGAHAARGFASLEEAAASISTYLPHRKPPEDLSGLAKNLRLGQDGRYRWHWDPRFLDSREHTPEDRREVERMMTDAARKLRIPVLLVRGRESELVGETEAEAFRRLAPHAEIADVSGARHMVAGDRNDVFTAAVADFLARLQPRARNQPS